MNQAKKHAVLNQRSYRHKTQKLRQVTLIQYPTDLLNDLPQITDEGVFIEFPSSPPLRAVLVLNPTHEDIITNIGFVEEGHTERRLANWLDGITHDSISPEKLATLESEMRHGLALFPKIEEPDEEWDGTGTLPRYDSGAAGCHKPTCRSVRSIVQTFRPSQPTRIPRPRPVVPTPVRRLVHKLLHPPTWGRDATGRATREWLSKAAPKHFNIHGIMRESSELRVYGRRVLGVDAETALWWRGMEEENAWKGKGVGLGGLMGEVGLMVGGGMGW
ncbi:hypothetical protein W97_04341 [Coniosporium apollinis CBS 100218]|uniref:Uncharacterized protein n=1 Tax=Coniosporium apollinis (strain CBS 100218) TaxID=1168221 RepID=R7YTA9_CONA1|nr:uncharacterized protein W97_04341 [Coniosporium apollinis CBS 100218]EON65105.1 hypothetical protein W97_04341 [Coniosporium apollinis CBS 100218]